MAKPRLPHERDEPVLTPAMRRSLVERRIVEAMQRGEFDNLPGAGKPLHIEPPSPVNPDLWWALKIMRQANVVPDEIRYRKNIDRLVRLLEQTDDEGRAIEIVRQLNAEIRQLNGMGTNVIPTTLTTFDEADVIARRRTAPAEASREGPSHDEHNPPYRV
jgi:hypothetical protein